MLTIPYLTLENERQSIKFLLQLPKFQVISALFLIGTTSTICVVEDYFYINQILN